MDVLRIADFTAGDDLQIEREVIDIPPGQSLAHAWLTVKLKPSDLDSAAILLKHITTALVVETGQITGAVALFVLSGAETALLTPGLSYYYAIKVKTDAGITKTIERGAIAADRGLIQAGS